MAAVRTSVVSLLGRDIAWSDQGEGGDPFVLVHGFGGSRGTWIFTQPALAAGARVLALDLPAHGESSPDVDDGGVEFFAAVLREFLDALGVRRARLVGHSLGAAAAATFAVAAPTRVASLALIAPAGLGRETDRTFLERLPEVTDPGEARALLALLVADPRRVGVRMVSDLLAWLDRPGVRPGLRRIVAANFPAAGQPWPYTGKLAELNLPVAILWGDADRVAAPPAAEGVILIPGAGHLPQLEAPAAVNRVLLA